MKLLSIFHYIFVAFASLFFFTLGDGGWILGIGIWIWFVIIELFLPNFLRPYIFEEKFLLRPEPPPLHALPEYGKSPEEDKCLDINLGIGSLIDCCAPLLLKNLDKKTWDTLLQSWDLKVNINPLPFHQLIPAIENKEVDIAVGSIFIAKEAVLQQNSNENNSSIKVVMPPLQLFNAYYLFAKRDHIINYLKKDIKINLTKHINNANENLSFYQAINKIKNRNTIMSQFLQEAKIIIENGADLDLALQYFYLTLIDERSIDKARIKTAPNRISNVLGSFKECDKLCVVMGGIVETTHLLRRCGPSGDIVLLVGPEDFCTENFKYNLNSFIIHSNSSFHMFRVLSWWFNVIHWLRREVLSNEKALSEAVKLIKNGLSNGDKSVNIVPSEVDDDDILLALKFLFNSSKENGSFLFPNWSEANSFEKNYDDFRRYNAKVQVLQYSNNLYNYNNAPLEELELGEKRVD